MRLSWKEKQENKKKVKHAKSQANKPVIFGMNSKIETKSKMTDRDKTLQARYNKLKQEGKL